MKKIIWWLKMGRVIVANKFSSVLRKERARPYKLSIKLMDECNFYCSTCGNWRKKHKQKLTRDELKECASARSKDLFMLTITGGEPFMDDKLLVDAVRIFKQHCPNLYFVSINTNAYFSLKIKTNIEYLLQEYSFLKLTLGVSHIPFQEWGANRTGVKDAYRRYCQTLEILQDLECQYPKQFDYYKMFTLSTTDDIKAITQDKKLWLNFVEVGEFYNNKDRESKDFLTKGQKLEAINKFYGLNKKHLSFVNKRFLLHWKRILNKGERNIKCYAGLNRKFLDSDGREYICIKQLRNRSEISLEHCRRCWTPCEGVFDIIGNFPWV